MVRYFVNDKECSYTEFCEQVKAACTAVADLSAAHPKLFIDRLARANVPQIINGSKFEVDADFNYVLVADHDGFTGLIASFNSEEKLLEMRDTLIDQWLAHRAINLSRADFDELKRTTAFYHFEVLNYE